MSECYLCLEPVTHGEDMELRHVNPSLDAHPAALADAGFDHKDYHVRDGIDSPDWCGVPFLAGFVCRRKVGHSGTHGCGGADTSQTRQRYEEYRTIEPTKEELAEVYRSLGVTPKEE